MITTHVDRVTSDLIICHLQSDYRHQAIKLIDKMCFGDGEHPEINSTAEGDESSRL